MRETELSKLSSHIAENGNDQKGNPFIKHGEEEIRNKSQDQRKPILSPAQGMRDEHYQKAAETPDAVNMMIYVCNRILNTCRL